MSVNLRIRKSVSKFLLCAGLLVFSGLSNVSFTEAQISRGVVRTRNIWGVRAGARNFTNRVYSSPGTRRSLRKNYFRGLYTKTPRRSKDEYPQSVENPNPNNCYGEARAMCDSFK